MKETTPKEIYQTYKQVTIADRESSRVPDDWEACSQELKDLFANMAFKLNGVINLYLDEKQWQERRNQIITDMKEQGFHFTSLVETLSRARAELRNTLDAINTAYPGLRRHQEIQNLESAIGNYDALIELYK